MTALALNPATPTIELLRTFGPAAEVPPESSPTLDQSLAYVRGLATSHYENFSVLSRLVPIHLRDDFAAVYAFCRWADDLADETGHDDAARARSTHLLTWWRTELDQCFASACSPMTSSPSHIPAAPGPSPRHPVFIALRRTVERHRPPIKPFADLIDAFQQDQRVTRYQTWAQVVDYCRRSADPVGRIVLHLGGYPENAANADRYRMSDAICTALQLTNFWQDVRRDLLERDRIYIPLTDTGLTADQLRDWARRPDDPAARVPFIKSLRPLVERTGNLFHQGRKLPHELGPHIRPVVWLFSAGGRAVLRAVERSGCATLWDRPKLGALHKASLVGRAWLGFRLFSSAAASKPAAGAHA